jgi:hypothetical protein
MRTRMIRISAGATTHGPTVKQATEALCAAWIPFTLQKDSPAVANGVEMPVGNEDGTTTGVLSASAASEG